MIDNTRKLTDKHPQSMTMTTLASTKLDTVAQPTNRKLSRCDGSVKLYVQFYCRHIGTVFKGHFALPQCVGFDQLRFRVVCARKYLSSREMEDSADLLEDLSVDTTDFWVNRTVPILHNPTPLQFMKEAVSRYHPVILTGIVDDWPALHKWSKEYFVETMGNRKLNVNITPDGHGDCVKSVHEHELPEMSKEETNYFVYPAEHDMTMSEFYELLDAGNYAGRTAVPYLSQQNDNLRQHLPELLADIQTSLPLATEVFSSPATTNAHDDCSIPSGALEAVNLWIGDERSVSSIHKDHFENMYVVVSGEKTFTLLPPSDVAYLTPYTKEYPTLRYAVKDTTTDTTTEKALGIAGNELIRNNKIQLELRGDGCPSEKLEWTALDPDDPEVSNKYPLFRRASPLRCTVKPGQVLYIPAMWYHRVSQNCLTVSVNYWYDQRFDFRYSIHTILCMLLTIAKCLAGVHCV